MSGDDVRETDFLVIGGGAAGCAAARVLVDGSDARVTLLESGGTNEREEVRDPTRARAVRYSDAGWQYRTVPQSGTYGRVHEWPFGRLMGGSTSINGMIWTRGAPSDYDGWAALGNPGWDAASVYDTFRRLEDFPDGDQRVHGTGGPVKIGQVRPDHPLTAAFLEACAQAGHQPTADFNGPEPEGYGTYALNLVDGERQDAARAFVMPVADRDTLDVVLGAHVASLDLNAAGDAVTSVSYVCDGRLQTIRVNEQVILSAGAIASPQVLLLSGIGDPGELRDVGIDVQVALPGVGRNLHDHVAVTIGYQASKPFPRSAYNFAEAGVYLRSDPSLEHYDLQMPFKLLSEYLPVGYLSDGPGYSFFAQLLTPDSRGTLRLRNDNPLTQPLIDPAYLAEPADLQRLVAAVKLGREIGAAPAFDAWRAREVAPGPGVTDEELRTYVRNAAWTCFHPAGTCRMGPDAGEAVVDHELKVHGIENLRVADTSIMPRLNVGNTTAPAMMIGWRAGEFALGAGRRHG